MAFRKASILGLIALGLLTLASLMRPASLALPLQQATFTTSPPAGSITVTLQQGLNDYAGAADTYLDKWDKAANHGTESVLRLRVVDEKAPILRFDLTGWIPVGAIVHKATLSLYTSYAVEGHPADAETFRVLRAWEEREATWRQARAGDPWSAEGCNAIGVDREGNYSDKRSIDQMHAWYDFDITEMAQAWVNNPASNFGVIIKAFEQSQVEHSFASSDDFDPLRRPKLVVVYSLPTPTPSNTPTATPTSTFTSTPTATSTPTVTATPSPQPPARITVQPSSLSVTLPVGEKAARDLVIRNEGVGNLTYELASGGRGVAGVSMARAPRNVDPTLPIVAGHFSYSWRQIEPYQGIYQWDLIDNDIAAMAERGLMAAFGISTYGGRLNGMETPDWVFSAARGGDPNAVIDANGWLIPRYWNETYLARYRDFVQALARRYDGDPRISWIAIGTGMYGETQPCDDRDDPYIIAALDADWGTTSDYERSTRWVETVNRITDIYADAFQTTPLVLQYMPIFLKDCERHDTTAHAIARQGIGLMHTGLQPDGNKLIGSNQACDNGCGGWDPLATYGWHVPVVWESYNMYLRSTRDVYWAVLSALDKHADFLNFSWDLFYDPVTRAARNEYYPIYAWANRYLGKTLQDTPSVWVAMREHMQPWFPPGGGQEDTWCPQWGNYTFGLVQDDSIPGGRTVAETNDSRVTSPAYNPLLDSSKESWVTRRTDQATGNPYMWFRIDDDYAYDISAQAIITVTYFDLGTDSWSLRYDGAADEQTQDTLLRVQKMDSRTWRKATFVLSDARFANGLEGGADFGIYCRSDGDEWVHFVEVKVVQPSLASDYFRVPWLTLKPERGIVPPGSSQVIRVTFDAQGQPGLRTAYILVSSNDANLPKIQIPISMNVQPVPSLGQVTGRVTDALRGSPLEAMVSAGDASTTTDSRTGDYTLWLEAGSYWITASATNYASLSLPVQVAAGGTTRQDFALQPLTPPPPTPTGTSPTPTATPTQTPNRITVVFQNGVSGYAGTEDTYIDAWASSQNYGTENSLAVRAPDVRASLLRFNVALIPRDATILNATLGLYALQSGGQPINLAAYRLLRPWNVSQANWQYATVGVPWGQPGANDTVTDRSAIPDDTQIVFDPYRWYDFDVTNMVQRWVADPNSNHGLILKAWGEHQVEHRFASANYPAPLSRPRLMVSYVVGTPPTITPTPTVSRRLHLPLVMRDYRRSAFSFSVSGCEKPLLDGDSILPRATFISETRSSIQITVEGSDIVMRHDDAIYNCCAVMVVTLEGQGPLLKFIERETYPVGEPCRCLCGWDITARAPNLTPGTYQVEVWDGMKPELLARAEVIIPG